MVIIKDVHRSQSGVRFFFLTIIILVSSENFECGVEYASEGKISRGRQSKRFDDDYSI